MIAEVVFVAPWLSRYVRWLESLSVSGAVKLTALAFVIALTLIALVGPIVWAYFQGRQQLWVRVVAGALKIIGVLLLAIIFMEPLFTGTRPRPGSNVFLVVADNSRSLQLNDRGHSKSRGAAM